MCRCVLPLSSWWIERVCKQPSTEAEAGLPSRLRDIEKLAVLLQRWWDPRGKAPPERDLLWLLQLVGSIALDEDGRGKDAFDKNLGQRARKIIEKAVKILANIPASSCVPMVYSVSLNRAVRLTAFTVADTASVKAIKADAARRLFALSCRDLTWAVLDSGIDATHPCFRRRDPQQADRPYDHPFEPNAQPGQWRNNTRVLKTYDFSCVRGIISDDPADFKTLPRRDQEQVNALDKEVRESLQASDDLNWTMLAPLLEIPTDDTYRKASPDAEDDNIPHLDHGTHVAGLLAGDWRATDPELSLLPPQREDVPDILERAPLEGFAGVCPDINLYDLRVINPGGFSDEFTVIAALQFIRHVNAHQNCPAIHGVNISLSILHDVANYACGRTPVCEECGRVIKTGTVVVAAAGNDGYLHYATSKGGQYEGYQTVSITDPGNAEEVITVGSTHREEPHTYGVSYFSSRGPTGDGRNKPDLVAPGEKINGPTPNAGMRWLDGTSMAAPHVSGAAALLMARHHELIGNPARVKQVMCATATDLGRKRHFQGAGMLDVLRALQSV